MSYINVSIKHLTIRVSGEGESFIMNIVVKYQDETKITLKRIQRRNPTILYDYLNYFIVIIVPIAHL